MSVTDHILLVPPHTGVELTLNRYSSKATQHLFPKYVEKIAHGLNILFVAPVMRQMRGWYLTHNKDPVTAFFEKGHEQGGSDRLDGLNVRFGCSCSFCGKKIKRRLTDDPFSTPETEQSSKSETRFLRRQTQRELRSIVITVIRAQTMTRTNYLMSRQLCWRRVERESCEWVRAGSSATLLRSPEKRRRAWEKYRTCQRSAASFVHFAQWRRVCVQYKFIQQTIMNHLAKVAGGNRMMEEKIAVRRKQPWKELWLRSKPCWCK